MSGPLAAPPPFDPARTALFADLDGTLTPIRPRPGDVGPDAGRARVLEAVGAALGGALAVVSGRALADLDRILEGRPTAIAAVHGLVRRSADGRIAQAGDAAGMDPARAAIAAFAAAEPALAVEDKGPSVAIHYRAAPDAEAACRDFAAGLAARHGLAVQAGDQVVEIRAPGATKADAVQAFMAEPPFAGRLPLFVGDDLTDEDGFLGAERLGGHGVIVGTRRPTRARYALADPGAVLAWLAASAAG